MNRNDAGWTDHIIGLMTEEEKVKRGDKDYPRIAGLRRVTPLIVGNIVSGVASPPVAVPGGVAVTFKIECLLKKEIIEEEGLEHQYEHWTGTADCTTENDGGNVYRGAFADTRAEGRAYVRLLRLSRCSAEEFDDKPKGKNNEVEVSVPSGADTKMHEVLCQRLGIDRAKFYNVCGRHKDMFGAKWNPANMTRDEAMKLGELLNEFQQGKQNIPPSITSDPF